MPVGLAARILSGQIHEDTTGQAAISHTATDLSKFLADAVLVLMPAGQAPLKLSLTADGQIKIYEGEPSGHYLGKQITKDLDAAVILRDSAAFAGPLSRKRQPSITIDPERRWDRLRGLIVLVAAGAMASAGIFASQSDQFRYGLQAANSTLAIGVIAADRTISRRRRDREPQPTKGIRIKERKACRWQVKLETAERLMSGETAVDLAAEVGVSPSTVRRWRQCVHTGGRIRLLTREASRPGSDENDYFTQRRVNTQISAVELILQGKETLPAVATRLHTKVSAVNLWVDEYSIGARRKLRGFADVIEDIPLPASPWEPPESPRERQLRQCLETRGFVGVKVLLETDNYNGALWVLQHDRPSETALDEVLDADWDRDGCPLKRTVEQCLGRELVFRDWQLRAITAPTVTSVSDVVRLSIVLFDESVGVTLSP